MITELFFKILKLSIMAGALILVILLSRLLLRKAPRWLSVAMWGLVAVRLIVPFSFKSKFSLFTGVKTLPARLLTEIDWRTSESLASLSTENRELYTAGYAQNAGAPTETGVDLLAVVPWIWLAGLVIMLVLAAVSYRRIAKPVRTAIPQAGVYRSEYVDSSFILGVLRPRIIVPFSLEEPELSHVLAHEKAHIARRDHWWKPLGYLLLSIHWFNPLMWLAYILLCRDIEIACDEKVVKDLDRKGRAAYSESILAASRNNKTVTACPLAFGAGSPKERVMSILNYKKPTFWVVAVAIVIVIVIAVTLLSDPKEPEPTHQGNINEETTPINSTTAEDTTQPTSEQDARLPLKTTPGKTVDKTPVAKNDGQTTLTLDDIVVLSGKGQTLSLQDLEPYKFEVTDAGLYLRRFPIDEKFSLFVGSENADADPIYYYLNAEDGLEQSMDIRDPGVEDFIMAHKDTPAVDMSLNAWIHQTILEYGKKELGENNLIESHYVLSRVDEEEVSTFYMVVYCEAIEADKTAEDGYNVKSGFVLPVALRVSGIKYGPRKVEEFWTPRDGEFYEQDVKAKFPKKVAEEAMPSRDIADLLQTLNKDKAKRLLPTPEN